MHLTALHINRTIIRLIYAHDDFHQGTLTGAISSDQREHFPLTQFHIDAFQHLIGTK